ncbi:ROK family protein [Paenibacillus selenitireducens]|uniref:ROK family protein n=1 Tax=Paenibacillus selenitireducens TaxID=1324314 RepID=A0A1T2XML6_9BACL|nr:ROK family protein [Paenibacillus selenitireducens]OPA80913.1 ROK family protein [Paenibacillus selenitireducens]
MKTTGDQFLVKKINKSIVLDTIRDQSPISRAAVSKMTGLNKGTVSSLVAELINNEFVLEIGTGKSSGGRKPVMLLFHETAGYAIGVELGVAKIRTILTNLNGEMVEEASRKLARTEIEYVTQELFAAIQSMIDLTPPSRYGIVGIGIGVPGIVDETGRILFAPNLQWENMDLNALISEHFQLPVTIDNEANAGAVGEQQYGAGRDAANIVYISVSEGIGTGIIFGRELFRGAAGLSGEMGHMTIEANGRKCRCGNKGCWELYASTSSHPQYDFDTLVQMSASGEADGIRGFYEMGEYLGIGISTIINTFNPELIIIGNQMMRAERWITSAIQQTVATRSLSYHRKHSSIRFAQLETRSTLLGAAYYAISGFFSKDRASLAETM